MRKRWVFGGVLIALLAVSTTGLAVNHSWLAGRWTAAQSTARLGAELRALDGVDTAATEYDPVGLPVPTVGVQVTFTKSAPTTTWRAAAEHIRVLAHGLEDVDTTATFSTSGSHASAAVDPLLVRPRAIGTEIDAWRALNRRLGDRVSLRLGADDDGSGGLVREYSVRTALDMRVVAERWTDLADPAIDRITTHWSAPGLDLHSMPTIPVMSTVRALSEVMPLAPAKQLRGDETGTFAVVLGNLRGFQVEIMSLRGGEPDHAAPDRTVVEGARIALASGAAQVDWMTADGLPSIVVGDCGRHTIDGSAVSSTFRTNSADEQFAESLRTAGLELRDDVRGGVCI